jgi:four helix bundle protein
MRDFKKLQVWSKAHELALRVYAATTSFPRAEMFGLTSQMRRAAISIASSIAEGCGRWGDGDMARSLQFAARSASELEYQFLLARDLGYLDQEHFRDLRHRLDEIGRMLTSLRQRVESSRFHPRSAGASTLVAASARS